MADRYGPVKCPDCGTWWRADEHRCPKAFKYPPIVTNQASASYTVECSCSFNPRGWRIPTTAICPIHDVQVNYTTTAPTRWGWGGEKE